MSKLLSVRSLYEKLKSSNNNLKIIDSTLPNTLGIRNFKRERIPGAQFLFLQNLTHPNSNKKKSFPPFFVFNHFINKLKIDYDDDIVFYDAEGSINSPRAFFIFKMYNFRNIFVLDGGLPKWRKENLPIEEVNVVDEDIIKDMGKETNFKDNIGNKLLFANYDEIRKENLRKNFLENNIIDCRSEKNYNFRKIPNSCNFNISSYFNDDKTFKGKEQYIAKLNQLDVNTFNEDLVTFCGTGITSCITHFIISEIIGNDKIKILEGSIEDFLEK